MISFSRTWSTCGRVPSSDTSPSSLRKERTHLTLSDPNSARYLWTPIWPSSTDTWRTFPKAHSLWPLVYATASPIRRTNWRPRRCMTNSLCSPWPCNFWPRDGGWSEWPSSNNRSGCAAGSSTSAGTRTQSSAWASQLRPSATTRKTRRCPLTKVLAWGCIRL